MAETEQIYIANLDFLLNYGDGNVNDEIEYEIYKVAFQIRGTVHYDRSMGGSFQNLEQEPLNGSPEVIMLKFSANVIESIYLANQEKSFNPYIVVGFSDISTQVSGTSLYVTITYRLLKDLTTQGQIKLEL